MNDQLRQLASQLMSVPGPGREDGTQGGQGLDFSGRADGPSQLGTVTAEEADAAARNPVPAVAVPDASALGSVDTSRADAAIADLRNSVGAGRQVARQYKADVTAGEQDMRAAGEEGIKANEQKNAALQPLQAEQTRLDSDYEKAVAARTEYRAKAMDQLNMMDQWEKKLASEQVHDAFAEAPTWLKVASIAATGLGAAAQAFYGDRTNVVTDQIDGALKRDLMFQRLRLEKNQQSYQNKGLLLKQFMDVHDHMQNAEDQAYVTMSNAVIRRMENQKKLLTSPEMRAAMDQNIAQMKMKQAESMARVNENMVGQDVRMKQAVAELEVQREKAKQAAAAKGAPLAAQTHVQGVQFPNGFQGDPKKEGYELRNLQVGTANVSQQLDKLGQAMDALSNTATMRHPLQKWEAYQQVHQQIAALVQLTKGKEFGNMGSRITEMQKKLDEQAFGISKTSYVDAELAHRLLAEAKQRIWEDFGNAVEGRGGQVDPEFMRQFGVEPGE